MIRLGSSSISNLGSFMFAGEMLRAIRMNQMIMYGYLVYAGRVDDYQALYVDSTNIEMIR